MKWFQASALFITFLFSATMVIAVIVAYGRPSGMTKIDIISMHEARTPKPPKEVPEKLDRLKG